MPRPLGGSTAGMLSFVVELNTTIHWKLFCYRVRVWAMLLNASVILY